MYKAVFPTAAALVYNSTFMDGIAAGAEKDDCVTNLILRSCTPDESNSSTHGEMAHKF